jgi:hypothetical protein
MKKFYTLLAFVIASFSAFSQATCVIDSTNTDFFSPRPDSIPCIERGNAYNQVIQIHVPDKFDIGPFAGLPAGLILLNVDSLQIDSLTGFPNGLSYALNPANGFFLGGANGCADLTGTTNDPVGNYPLDIYGYIAVSGIPPGAGFPPDTMFDLHQAQGFSNMFQLSVDVINPGDECRPVASGIGSFNSNLNTFLSVYPNPTSGVFTVKLNTGRRINGEISVLNMTGQTVISQAVDVMNQYATVFNLSQLPKGLYTVVVKTTEGIAAKNVSVE